MKKIILSVALVIGSLLMLNAQDRLRLNVYGLNHDHISGFLSQYRSGTANVVGIYEPSKPLWEKFKKRYNLPDSIYFDDVKKMIRATRPDVMLGYNEVGKHVDIVEVCAPLGVPVMVEKPLAATLAQAKRIEFLANKYHVTVLTNYETTWYASYQDVYNTIGLDSVGQIRKMVFHDGHKGPREIGCSEEFLAWLTDPVLNGAGALNDFGCYGADLMTWLMHGQRPIAITAIAKHYKPKIYPKVEDDATIIVEYPTATGLIEASWNWPLNIKDMEIFGEKGYMHAFDGNNVQLRLHDNNMGKTTKAKPLPAPINDPMTYLYAVIKKKIPAADDQSSLKYNMIAMEILDAAKRSINEGKRIIL